MSDQIVPGTHRTRRFWFDLGERVFWTGVQVGVAGVSVEVFDLPGWAVGPVAVALAGLKALAARKVGDRDSASLP